MEDETRAAEPPLDAIEELVAECLAQAQEGGEAPVEELCRRFPSLRQELQDRIEALRRFGLMPGRPATVDEEHRSSVDGPDAPERLGDFRLLRRLGAGGMGVVYLAEQITLGRRVALKLMRPEHLYFPQSRLRFRREIDAIARLQHPGIVPVHAVGEEQGLPYFAMEYVAGATLAQLVERLKDHRPETLRGRHALSIVCALAEEPTPAPAETPELYQGTWAEAAVRITHSVATALAHAHERGILHRDVKPSNVILTPSGRVLLLDFGLALLEGAEQLTRTGSQLGSLPYMPPEQVRGAVRELDRRSDVYSLGVTFFELLTLCSPYHDESTEVARARILSGTPPPLRRLNPSLSWEVETVCLKAMECDAARRYPDAASLAQDLSNVLGHRPIAAKRAGLALQARRWSQRHPAIGVAIVLGFLLVVVAPSLFAWRVTLAATRTRAALRRSEGLSLVNAARTELMVDPALALLLAIEGDQRNDDENARTVLVAALNTCLERRRMDCRSPVRWSEFSPDGNLVACATSKGDAMLWNSKDGALLAALECSEAPLSRVRFSADGDRLLATSTDGNAYVFDVPSRQRVAILRGHQDLVLDGRFDSSRRRIVTGSEDKTARIWDAEDGRLLHTLVGHDRIVPSVAFDSSGERVLTGGYDGSARIWATASGAELIVMNLPHEYWWGVFQCEFSPDESLVVASSNTGKPCVFEARTGELRHVLAGHEHEVMSSHFSPDGTRIVTAGCDGTARLWDVESGRQLRLLNKPGPQVLSAVFSPDGRRVLTARFRGHVEIWEAESGKLLTTLRGHAIPPEAGFDREGSRVLTWSNDGTVRIWDATGEHSLDVPAHDGAVLCMSLSPDGALLATTGADGKACLFDEELGRRLAVLDGHQKPVTAASFSADGTRLALAADDRTASFWDVATRQRTASIPEQEVFVPLAGFSPDGTRYVTTAGNLLRLWSEERVRLEWKTPELAVEFVQALFLDDVPRLLVRTNSGLARMIDGRRPGDLLPVPALEGEVVLLALSSDARTVVACWKDGRLRAFETAGWTLLHEWPPEVAWASEVHFSPDGARFIAGSHGNGVIVWDVKTWSEIARIPPLSGILLALDSDRTGRRVATVSAAGAQVWDADTGRLLATLQRSDADVTAAALSSDGSRMWAGFTDGRVQAWTLYDDPLTAARASRPRELDPSERARFELRADSDE